MVLYGERAGEVSDRLRDAQHGICYRCYTRQTRSVRRRRPDVATAPYRPSNRHVRKTIPIPSQMIAANAVIDPPALRIYTELLLRGADRTWVAASLMELAEALGYSRFHVYNVVRRLAPRYVQVRRESPRGVPAFRIIRALDGAD